MKITIGYDKYMEKSLIECFSSDDRGIIIIHFLGISITILRKKYLYDSPAKYAG